MAPADTARTSVHDLDGEELAAYIAAHTARWGVPPLAGGDDGEADDAGDDDNVDEEAPESDDTDDDAAGDDDGAQDDDDPQTLKRMARKHERRSKAKSAEIERLQRELEESKKAGGKTDSDDDAVAAARREEREKVLAETREQLREQRLESAVTRLAAGTFADPDDALVHIERAIRRGDLDKNALFDEAGKPDPDALRDELEALLEQRPHLAAVEKKRTAKAGATGSGRGSGAAKTADDKSVEDFDRALRKRA